MFSGFCKQKILEISQNLALGELRCATGGFETVLLSFLHSGVAGHEAGGLQSGTVLGVHDHQGTGNAVTDGAEIGRASCRERV